MTGARYGELIRCNVSDYDPNAKTLRVDGKTGPRTVVLQPDAVSFFNRMTSGRNSEEPLLRRTDGGRWNRSHQQRRMAATLERAGLDPDGTFYALRHTYISRAIEGRIPLNIIAANCGTSIRMIEKTYAKILAKSVQAFIDAGAPSFAVKHTGREQRGSLAKLNCPQTTAIRFPEGRGAALTRSIVQAEPDLVIAISALRARSANQCESTKAHFIIFRPPR